MCELEVGSPDGNGLCKPVSVVDSVDDWRTVNTKRVNHTHGSQTVDAHTRLLIDVKDFLLTVDLVGTAAGRAVVIGEETVQARSEHEDITRFRDVQAPRSRLATGECRIFPLREGSVQRPWRWGVGLEIGRLGLWEAEVMIRRPSEVVVRENVMLGPRSYEPDWALGFRQQTPGGVNCDLISVQGLEVVVREPDPRALEVTVRSGCEMDGQERRETIAVSNPLLWALGDL